MTPKQEIINLKKSIIIAIVVGIIGITLVGYGHYKYEQPIRMYQTIPIMP